MKEKLQFEISSWSVLKVILILLLFYLLILIRDIIALFFVVLILVATFRPVVNKWEKAIKRIPAVIALLIIAVVIISALIYLIIPPIIDQAKQFIVALPDLFSKYSWLRNYTPVLQENVNSITNDLGNVTSGVLSITAGVFGGIITFLTAIVMTIYMLLDKQSLTGFATSVFPVDKKEAITNLISKIVKKIGDWFRGQLILALFIGVIDFIGLTILGVPYALTLAVISGILEIVPTVGPIISGVIAALIALQISPLLALIVILYYVAIQWLESSIIVPKVMQKAVGLSPVVIILAILIGAKLLGITGAILAVPIAATLSVLIQEWSLVKQTFEK